MIEYSMIKFERFKPYNMEKSISKIKKMKYYNEDIEIKPDVSRYKNSYKKLYLNQPLLKRDYKILLYYLDDIIEYSYDREYKILYQKFDNDIDKFTNCKSFIRPLSMYIFNKFDNLESKNIFRLLKKVINNTKEREKTKFIKLFFSDISDVNQFYKKVKLQFDYVKDTNDIDELLKNLFMSKEDKFFLNCIVKFIIENHFDKKLRKEFVGIVDRMDLKLKKEVYTGIILYYKDTFDVDKYDKKWFEKIREDLGKPYESRNIKWSGMPVEAKEIFRRWYNNQNLYEFFLKISSTGDRRRLNYWKQYIDCIYDIQYFEEVDNALVMEFKNHTLVEFAKNGNACFVYDRKIRNIDKLKLDLQRKIYSKSQKTRYLKRTDLCYKRLVHRSGWEYDFDSELNRLGYEKREY